jgi:monofunctional biosynthetic peptidoglycan transglycosylase
MARTARPKPKARRPLGRALRLVFATLLVVLFIGPVLVVAVYRFAPPPITFLMVQRAFEGRGFSREWVPIERISPSLVRAVIAAEDARFCEHHGFDLIAIRKAAEANARGGKIRGGSTISQQTAKNVFLWPHRDWIRKGLEVEFTGLIELMWGKRRIMEVYLNSIEWAPGVYGAEAASRYWFKVPAAKLTPAQSARLAAIVPKPLAWRAARPGPYVRSRSGKLAARAGVVKRQDLDACVL